MKLFTGKLPLALTGLLALGAFTQSEPVVAETQYITDVVYVPLRAGPGNQYRILHRGLKTGVKMTVTEADAGNGYSKILTADGREGYILKQYLVTTEPARDRLPKALQHIESLTAQNKELSASLGKQGSELKGLQTSLKATSEKLEEKNSEYIALREATADPQALERRNKQLMEENLKLKSRVEVVEVENAQLLRSTSMRWYLYGGGTILMGILLGIFLPRLRLKRKPSSDWV